MFATLLFIFCATLFALTPPARAARATQSLYEYDQTFPVEGTHKIKLWSSSMRKFVPQMGYYLESSDTDRTITIWRPADKSYAKVEYDTFMKTYRNMGASVGWFSELKKPISQKLIKVEGIAATEHLFAASLFEGGFWRSEIGTKRENSKKQPVKLITLALPCSKHTQALMCKLYGLPALQGIPWEIKYADRGRTVSSIHGFNLRKSTQPFKPFEPKGYKKISYTASMMVPMINEDAASIFLP